MFTRSINNLQSGSFEFESSNFVSETDNGLDVFFKVSLQLAKCEKKETVQEFCDEHGHPFFVFVDVEKARQPYGIKIKTHGGTLNYHKEILKDWKLLTSHATRAGFKGHEAKNCWMSVSFNKDLLNNTVQRKIDLFVSNNYDFFKRLSRRTEKNYSIVTNKLHHELGINTRKNKDPIVYLENEICFNFFRSTLKTETIIATIELCHSLIYFLRDTGVLFDDLYDQNQGVFRDYKSYIMGGNKYPYLKNYIETIFS